MLQETLHANLNKQMKLATVIEEAFGNSGNNENSFAILLNAVYLGLCKQMAIAVEKISTSPQQTESTETIKPSDEAAVH